MFELSFVFARPMSFFFFQFSSTFLNHARVIVLDSGIFKFSNNVRQHRSAYCPQSVAYQDRNNEKSDCVSLV